MNEKRPNIWFDLGQLLMLIVGAWAVLFVIGYLSHLAFSILHYGWTRY